MTSPVECESCGRPDGKPRKRLDPWGRSWFTEDWCDACEDNRELPEPGFNATSATERAEMAWKAKEVARGPMR